MIEQAEFGKKVKSYLRQARKQNGSTYLLEHLAAETSLNDIELKRKLYNRSAISESEVKVIIKALAKFEAITIRKQASELLTLMDYPDFGPEDWANSPLVKLKDKSSQTLPTELFQLSGKNITGIIGQGAVTDTNRVDGLPQNEFDIRCWATCDRLLGPVQTLIDYYNNTYNNDQVNERNFSVGNANQINRINEVSSTEKLDLSLVGKLFTRVANFYLQQSLYSEAHSLFEQALTISTEALGSNHLDLVEILAGLYAINYNVGDDAVASVLLKQIITITEKNLGREHRNLIEWLRSLAWIIEGTGEVAEAILLYKRAVAITEKTFGSKDIKLARELNSLGRLLYAIEDYAAARPLFERAITIAKKTLPSDHFSLAGYLVNLAKLLHATDEQNKALVMLKRALTILNRYPGYPYTDEIAQMVSRWENEINQSSGNQED